MALFSGLAWLGQQLGMSGSNERGRSSSSRQSDELNKLGSRPRRGKPQIGTAITREELEKRKAAGAVDATNPVDLTKAESTGISDARAMALRAKRRAAAGNSGRVKLPGGTNVGAGGAPRTLLGY